MYQAVAKEALENLDIRNWSIVTPVAGRPMIGILHSHPEEFVMCPALEFSAEYTEMRDPHTGRAAVVKVPMVTGVDFLMDATVPQYLTSYAKLYRLGEASAADQAEYVKIIRAALDNLVAMQARRLGVVAPTGNSILMGSSAR